jgi:hypothetical protein
MRSVWVAVVCVVIAGCAKDAAQVVATYVFTCPL